MKICTGRRIVLRLNRRPYSPLSGVGGGVLMETIELAYDDVTMV